MWKYSAIISKYKTKKPLDFPASFQPIHLLCCILKQFEWVILSRLFLLLECNIISLPSQADFTLFSLLFIESFSVISSLQKHITNPYLDLKQFCYSWLLNSIWFSLSSLSFPQDFFYWYSSLLCLVDSILFFLIGALAYCYTIKKPISFVSAEEFWKNPLSAMFCLLFSSMIFLTLFL